jgi:hypothetical protein
VTYEDEKMVSVVQEYLDTITNEWYKVPENKRMGRMELRRAFHATMKHEHKREKKSDAPVKA